MKKVLWRDINSTHVPPRTGVYAWYYDHILSRKDIEDVIETIVEASNASDKAEIVTRFLEEQVFRYYRETPYFAEISGPLKPKYSGTLCHENAVSRNMVEKIINKPEMLLQLKEQLRSISFNFSSPLYIGMSKDLLSRVKRHKSLIEKYKVNGIPREYYDANDSEVADHNFAARVVERKFVHTQLYLVYEEVESEGLFHNVFENILNRINYPLLGRN